MDTHEITNILYALIIGIIPALFWLWFWLREDNEHPEPRSAILLTFIGGMIAVVPAIFLQYGVNEIYPNGYEKTAIFALIEELLKILVIYLIAYKYKKTLDEPLDFLIYTITSALGFAAIENTLYVLKPIYSDNLIDSITSGNLRFIGATLVHIASTAAIGVFMATVYYRHLSIRLIATLAGIIWGTALHTLFNIFIIRVSGQDILYVFLFVWIGIVTLLISFEFIKRIRPKTI